MTACGEGDGGVPAPDRVAEVSDPAEAEHRLVKVAGEQEIPFTPPCGKVPLQRKRTLGGAQGTAHWITARDRKQLPLHVAVPVLRIQAQQG